MTRSRQHLTDRAAFALAAQLDFLALPRVLAGAAPQDAYPAALADLDSWPPPRPKPAKRPVTGDLFEWRKTA